MPLQGAGCGSASTGRLWGCLGAGQREENGLWVDHPPTVLFEFTESREALHPVTFLADYQGYLQAAAHSGYSALYRGGRVMEVVCWAHCRCKFFKIAKVQKTSTKMEGFSSFIVLYLQVHMTS